MQRPLSPTAAFLKGQPMRASEAPFLFTLSIDMHRVRAWCMMHVVAVGSSSRIFSPSLPSDLSLPPRGIRCRFSSFSLSPSLSLSVCVAVLLPITQLLYSYSLGWPRQRAGLFLAEGNGKARSVSAARRQRSKTVEDGGRMRVYLGPRGATGGRAKRSRPRLDRSLARSEWSVVEAAVLLL